MRFNPAIGGQDCAIKLRQLFELEDFGPGEAVERFREMGVGAKSWRAQNSVRIASAESNPVLNAGFKPKEIGLCHVT